MKILTARYQFIEFHQRLLNLHYRPTMQGKWLLFSVTHRDNYWELLVNPPAKNFLNIFLTVIKQNRSFQLRENYSALLHFEWKSTRASWKDIPDVSRKTKILQVNKVLRELQCAIAYYQCHAQQKLEGQRAKNWRNWVTLAVLLVKIDFGFELTKKKRLTA